MYYVYILKANNKLYIGYSNNLKRRLSEHHKGKVYSTRRVDNLELIYYESYNDIDLAKNREKKLKQHGSAYQGLLKRLGLNK